MDARVEDCLLREAVRMEVNGRDELAGIAERYERLVDAVRDGRSLGEEHAGLARQAESDDIESIRVAMGVGEQESFSFSRSPSPVESVHDLAVLLDALLAVGALQRADVEAFLVRRAEVARRAMSTAPGDSPPGPGLMDAAIDGVLADWSPGEAMEALFVLLELGVLSMACWEATARALRDAHPELGDDSGVVSPSEVGEVRETLLGSSGRWCGVRVLATELCEHGVLVHIHQAVNPTDGRGQHEPLADELAADAATWPVAPVLDLHDDHGTAYRGRVESYVLDVEELQDEGLLLTEIVAFAPAMPAAATRLWLSAPDGRPRIDLT